MTEYRFGITVTIGEDRRVTIELPPDVPIGPADLVVVVYPQATEKAKAINPAREEVRARLHAAGRLSFEMDFPDDVEPLSEEELEELGRLPPGSPTAQEIIDEEREERWGY